MLENSPSARDDSIEIDSQTSTAGSALLGGGDGILASNLAPVGGQISSGKAPPRLPWMRTMMDELL